MCDPPNPSDYKAYFDGAEWSCAACGHRQNLWSKLHESLLETNVFFPGTIGLGLAAMSVLPLGRMSENQAIEVDLNKLGIPADATVLDVVITTSPDNAYSKPEDAVHPLLPTLPLHHLSTEIPREFVITPVQWASGPIGVGGTVAASVVWLAASPEPEMEPLVAAALAFSREDFRAVVIPANIAVEAKLNAVLTSHFSQFAGKGDVKSFLTSGATYGHQLRFLWPSLFGRTSAPPLPSELTSDIRALNARRNTVAHQHGTVSRAEAARLLLAATFGYHYLDLYAALLGPAPTGS
jgi:hypothetical protein